MAVRRRRLRLVLDTNILLAALLTRDPRSPNLRLYRLWGERQIQLIVSTAIEEEYLAVLAKLGVSITHRQRFALRLRSRKTVTYVQPRRAVRVSRDPSDNAFIEAAVAGEADFLVTNDQDLLRIPLKEIRSLRLRISTPRDVLDKLRKRRS